jgi:hypothetical protein
MQTELILLLLLVSPMSYFYTYLGAGSTEHDVILSPDASLAIGKLTQRWTDFELKGGKVM